MSMQRLFDVPDAVAVYRATSGAISVEVGRRGQDAALLAVGRELARLQALLADETARCCAAQMELEHYRGLFDLGEPCQPPSE